MKLHIKMEVSKQQLERGKKVKYQECLCLALDLGRVEVSFTVSHIHVFLKSYFKEGLYKIKFSSLLRKRVALLVLLDLFLFLFFFLSEEQDKENVSNDLKDSICDSFLVISAVYTRSRSLPTLTDALVMQIQPREAKSRACCNCGEALLIFRCLDAINKFAPTNKDAVISFI